MRFWKKNDGLTLVELIVSIAIGTMIFAAATTVLLLGIRIHHHTTDSIMQQYTARTVIEVFENLVKEGTIERVDGEEDGSWTVVDGTGKVLLSYHGPEKTIYTGAYPKRENDTEAGSPILENVEESAINLDGRILKITIKDTKETYQSSVYCRTQVVTDGKEETTPPSTIEEDTSRKAFLKVLNSQMGQSFGLINHEEEKKALGISSCDCEKNGFTWFSEWYIGGFTEAAVDANWGEATPWCSCFVSWGLVKAGLNGPEDNLKWFADVDSFKLFLENNSAWTSRDAATGKKLPKAGDLIFFDTNLSDDDHSPSHVGVVCKVEDGSVYTIEGNVMDNDVDKVKNQSYSLTYEEIIGYGDPWAAQAKSNNNT